MILPGLRPAQLYAKKGDGPHLTFQKPDETLTGGCTLAAILAQALDFEHLMDR